MQNWAKFIFSTDVSFEEKVYKVFQYQFEHNRVYQRYCNALEIKNPDSAKEIALLPIKAFKDTEVVTANNSKFKIQNSKFFRSSGTLSTQRCVHRVSDISIYDQSIFQGFKHFYDLESSVIWGYTPRYDKNQHSSLIYMIQRLIEQDVTGLSRFLTLGEPIKAEDIEEVKSNNKQLIIFGAAFGLLDLLEIEEVELPSNSIIIETGGMKTHRREISRDELHRKLAKGFGLDVSRIHSEYGMCEMLSQAYSTGGKWFRTVPWMKVSILNPDNPFEELPAYSEGLIGVIDLANVHSCSFLLTGDKGIMDDRGRFQVLGRWNPKDLRGCNFLIEED